MSDDKKSPPASPKNVTKPAPDIKPDPYTQTTIKRKDDPPVNAYKVIYGRKK